MSDRFLKTFLVAALAGAGCSGTTAQSEAGSVERSQTSQGEFSYAVYGQLLQKYVDPSGQVDYAGLKEDADELDRFVGAMEALTPADIDSWPEAEQIAFWINAYNAITLKYVVDHYPIQKDGLISGALYPANSIRQIPGVWDTLTTPVAGSGMTLDYIEHQILRKEFTEPRIHFAIVCASVGCPPLRDEPFVGDRLEQQLSDQADRFLGHPDRFRIDADNDIVYLSPIFDWFGKDFIARYKPSAGFDGQKEPVAAVLNFVAGRQSPEDAGYLRAGGYRVKFTDYDWSLNQQ